MVGRAGGIGDDRRARVGLGLSGRARRPSVLADRQPDPGPGDLDHLVVGPRDEVALLVEDRVVGEAVLAVDALDGAIGEDGERVVGVAVVAAALDRLGEADHHRDPRRQPRREPLDRPDVGGEEVALQVEVLGRVAGDAEARGR